jgi:hypothetical protein
MVVNMGMGVGGGKPTAIPTSLAEDSHTLALRVGRGFSRLGRRGGMPGLMDDDLLAMVGVVAEEVDDDRVVVFRRGVTLSFWLKSSLTST